MKNVDLPTLYYHMYRSRLFEEHIVRIWNDGLITGEMHTGIGEEAVNAGVVSQLVDGDALALDHRGTSPALMRGVDPKELLLEFVGHQKGLCSGMGGHMHLFSKSHLLASSGIVGASGPAAVGFALAAHYVRPGKVAVAFFGEGAVNQGMLMESLNLASVLKLPILFVCKDNGVAITTKSSNVTAGTIVERIRSFDIPAEEVDGTDVALVWNTANKAIEKARSEGGPSFILAKCNRPQGHFLGDPLLRIVNKPMKEFGKIAGPMVKSATKFKGGSLKERMDGLLGVVSVLGETAKNRFINKQDPLVILKKRLQDHSGVTTIEDKINSEMKEVVQHVFDIFKKSSQA